MIQPVCIRVFVYPLTLIQSVCIFVYTVTLVQPVCIFVYTLTLIQAMCICVYAMCGVRSVRRAPRKARHFRTLMSACLSVTSC